MYDMTMQDPRPGNGREYVPHIDVDHDKITQELKHLLGDDIDMKSLINAQRLLNDILLRKLMDLGYYFVPIDGDDTVSEDTTLYDIHNVATICALTSLDVICEHLGVDKVKLKDAWAKSTVLEIVDTSHEDLATLSMKEKHQAVAQGIVVSGHELLSSMPTPYIDLVEDISDHESVVEYSNIFKGVYGYVLAAGYKRLSMMNDLLQSMTFDIDAETAKLFEEDTSLTVAECTTSFMDIDHETISDQIDTEIYYSDDSERSIAKYLGEFIEYMLDIDDETVEMCHKMALALHPNERKLGLLDDIGEASLYGQVFALNVLENALNIAEISLIDVLEYWKQQDEHSELEKSDVSSKAVRLKVSQYVTKKLAMSMPPTDYDQLIGRACEEQGYSDQEAAAFKEGFLYVLLTGSDAAANYHEHALHKLVTTEMQNIDDELAKLLEGNE